MKINCHTNLDLHPCERWPNELPCRPIIGDIITSSTDLELAVVRVRFKKDSMGDGYYDDGIPAKKVICSVELHLVPHRFENITEFEKWYRKRP